MVVYSDGETTRDETRAVLLMCTDAPGRIAPLLHDSIVF